MQPKYIHDCHTCVYLASTTSSMGDSTTLDWYICDGGTALSPTVLYRHGHEGHEYGSYPIRFLARLGPVCCEGNSEYLVDVHLMAETIIRRYALPKYRLLWEKEVRKAALA
jgi:hypothetical protein